MRGFCHAHQAALLEPYFERFFATLPDVARERDRPFLRAYAANLFPHQRPDPDLVARARSLADAEGERLPSLRRLLLEAADDMERAVVCRSYAALAKRRGV
jgi:aminopeptidase N